MCFEYLRFEQVYIVMFEEQVVLLEFFFEMEIVVEVVLYFWEHLKKFIQENHAEVYVLNFLTEEAVD